MREQKEPKSFSDVVDILSEKIDGVEATLSKRIDEVETSLSKRINEVETSLSKRIDEVEESLGGAVDVLALQIHGINGRLDGIDGRLDGIDKRLDGHDTRFDLLEEGLDRRFASLHGDMMQVIGMGNDKLLAVVDVLHGKGTVTTPERRTIRLMKPFPRR